MYVLALVLFPLAAGAAAPAQTASIKLQDPTSGPSVTKMQIVVDHQAVHAGRVTFTADNLSKSEVHEVIVARDDGKAMPFDRKRDEVIEKRIRKLGEIGDLAPGKSGTLTLTLAPGRYLLFCNEPGHYAQGMKTALTVSK
jgi:uncharacterized cupredoxin-like copper-binding protein